jgi:hypothetical protein
VVEALDRGGEPTQAVKAGVALTGVDSGAQGLVLEKIRGLDVSGKRESRVRGCRDSTGAEGRNFVGQAHFDDVAGFGTLDEAQSAMVDETAHGLACGGHRKTSAASQPSEGKAQPETTFETAVAQEVRINDAINHREAKQRHDIIFQLFPDKFGIGFLGFHRQVL